MDSATATDLHYSACRKFTIRNGEIGYGYDRIFENCLDERLTSACVEDPFIRSDFQIQNFFRFCKLLDRKCKNLKRITLITADEGRQYEAKIEQKIKRTLGDRLHFEYKDFHDRKIDFDNGWRDTFSGDVDDMNLRPCKATTITILRDETNVNADLRHQSKISADSVSSREESKKTVKRPPELTKGIGVGLHAETNDGTDSNVKSEAGTSSEHPNIDGLSVDDGVLEGINFTKPLSLKLALKIFGYLYEGDLAQCALVSREFRAIANHQILWKSLYQEVFEYSLPLLHVGHAQFEFRESHDWPQPRSDESIVVNPWKESFKQLRNAQALQKDGIHVRPGYASLYSGFGAGGRCFTQCDRLDQALQLVEARGENAEKLIFLHTGLYILETTMAINSDIQIIGASADPDIASRVIIEGRLTTTVTLAKGSQDAYLGWMTVRFAPDSGAIAAAIAAGNPPVRAHHFALQIRDDSTALVEQCVIRSSAATGAAVCVNGSAANPKIRHCVVCDCESGGIYVMDAAQGQFEDCEIARNTQAGVVVSNHANPFFRQCHIHDGRDVGIFAFDHGMGYFESCNIHNNRFSGIRVRDAANPTVTRCEIHHGKSYGIHVHNEGRGQFMENRIHSNTFVGIEIKSHSDPTITRNKIRGNKEGGIAVIDNGQGVLEDNEIFDNAMAGVRIETDGNPTLRRNKIHNGRDEGIYISDKGCGVLEDNDIFHNRFGGLFLATGAKPTLRDNTIYDNDDLVEKTIAPFESRFSDKYAIQAVVGRGALGVVFKAQHELDERLYAIKRVYVADTEQSRNKVLREVHSLAKLDHPHIVRYYDAWMEKPPPGEKLPRMNHNQPCLYIRMEWCSGPTLHEWLEQNQLPEQRPISQTLDWFSQLVSAVKYIHDAGRIHRDIKPGNIFFGSSRNGAASVLKIGDFGLAIDVTPSSSSGVSGGVRACLSNAGTKNYMSPEQPSGRCKNSTDIFSLGLVFLEMLYPFKTDMERYAVFGALRSGKRPDVMDELDKKMDELINWMTAFKPEKRATSSELDNELRKMSSTSETNFTDLPLKLMLKILGYLYEDDLTRCALVSRKFRDITNHQILWKLLYQEVFEYSLPLLHIGHAQFEFREPHESIVVNPWKESFKQLRNAQALQKDGIHVRPGYASLYSGFGADGLRLTQCDRLEQALQLVEARGENAEKLIFLHTGLYILETTVMINSDIQIIGASAGPDIASQVTIEGRHATTVILAEGSQGAYLGWMTVRVAPNSGAVAAAIADEYLPTHVRFCALQICDDSTALVEHCAIHSSAATGAAVCVNGSAANPKIRHCVVCDCESGGIYVMDAAQGQFEDCEIARNDLAGIRVNNCANPFFRRCHIYDGRGAGIFTFDHGMGYFESCNIHNNRLSGIEVEDTANPTVTRCEVHHGRKYGVYVHNEGRGQFMENRIYSNASVGIRIESRSDPKITHNKMWGNEEGGVLVRNNGQGMLEDNEIFDNAMAGVEIQTDGNPMMIRNKIYNERKVGVLISHKGRGVLEENEIFDNAMAGVRIDTDGNPTLKRNKIYDGRVEGVYISNKGRGVLEDNDIYRNTQAGVIIESESNPTLRRNRIYEGRAAGIEIGRGAMATLESNAIFHNRFGGLFLVTGVRPTLRDNKIYDNDDLVEKTIAKGGCLFEITSRTSSAIHGFYCCDTCNTTKKNAICLNCIRTCHTGHTVHLVRYDSFFCRCGAGMLKHQCKLQSEARATQSGSANTTESAPSESKKLCEYTTRTEIGHGAFSVVFKAQHKIDKRWYAIKQVGPVDAVDMTDTEQSRNKVLREVHFLAKLDHPHIVRYYDAWMEKPPPGEKLPRMNHNQPCLYIRMEWCSGPTLHEWLGQNQLPEQRPTKQTLGWFRQLASAVKYIHDKGLIHRDIKPQNIFFESSRYGVAPVLKIGDFGLAIDVAPSSSSGVSGGVSKILSIVGTLSYMSPEQPSGNYMNSTDIFSLGLVFLEIVQPFGTDMERFDVFWSLRLGGRPDVMDKLDGKMNKLISRMTAFEQKKRPTSSELDNELEKMTAEQLSESAKEIEVGPHAETNDGTDSNVKSKAGASSTHPNESARDNEDTAKARAEATVCVGDLGPSPDSTTDLPVSRIRDEFLRALARLARPIEEAAGEWHSTLFRDFLRASYRCLCEGVESSVLFPSDEQRHDEHALHQFLPGVRHLSQLTRHSLSIMYADCFDDSRAYLSATVYLEESVLPSIRPSLSAGDAEKATRMLSDVHRQLVNKVAEHARHPECETEYPDKFPPGVPDEHIWWKQEEAVEMGDD